MTDAELAALRTASDARLARKRIADAKLIARVPVFYRCSPMNIDPPKIYGRPWMERRKR